jgi:adenine-specific DNA-methyltransferase
MRDSAHLKKARGAFFTPPEITDFLADWAIRTPDDSVLEPSCGEAAFLASIGRRLSSWGSRPGPEQVTGVEIHAPSAQSALRRLASADIPGRIHILDFFEFDAPPIYAAVIGNPPYIRYQGFTGEARARGQRAALGQGVRLDGLASSWAAFVVHAARFLKPDGRLALVLPAELLSVNYAGPVRRFLLERFGSVRLVLFEERVFPGVLEEVVLLLAEGQGPTDHFEVSQVSDLGGLRELSGRKFYPALPDRKWTPALLASEAAQTYVDLTEGESFVDLLDWGDPDLGIVTGGNAYFCLTASKAAKLRIPVSERIAISPRGSRHLRGLTFTARTWEELARADAPVYLFYPKTTPSVAAQRYIEEGERLGIDQAYKCRVRSPWWRVPLVPMPDLFFTYMNHDTPRLVANRARVLPLNSIHGVRLDSAHRRIGMDLLPMAMLNSLTLLGAELVGRSYGGGILKLEPKEADRLPVPSLAVVRKSESDLRALRPQLAQHLRQGRLHEVAKTIDRAILSKQLGLRHEDLLRLRDAREELFGRRTARNGG